MPDVSLRWVSQVVFNLRLRLCGDIRKCAVSPSLRLFQKWSCWPENVAEYTNRLILFGWIIFFFFHPSECVFLFQLQRRGSTMSSSPMPPPGRLGPYEIKGLLLSFLHIVKTLSEGQSVGPSVTLLRMWRNYPFCYFWARNLAWLLHEQWSQGGGWLSAKHLPSRVFSVDLATDSNKINRNYLFKVDYTLMDVGFKKKKNKHQRVWISVFPQTRSMPTGTKSALKTSWTSSAC